MRAISTALASILLCSCAFAETIRVGAAISLKDAVSEIASAFEADGGAKVEFTFGSSGQLQAQIENGADIDLFISAANKQVDELAKKSLVIEKTRRTVAGNTLVLVVPAGADAPGGFDLLADSSVKKLAIGEPKTVPAGQYAMQVLTKLKLGDVLADRIVYGSNVRQVLNYVERGEVSAGIVYATDAKESGDKVKVVAAAKPDTHEPIVYPAVIVAASRKQAAATKFLDYLGSEKARQVFIAKGFSAPAEASGKKPSE